MSWREWAAAQYNHVLSIMRDTMDKTLFVRCQDGGGKPEKSISKTIEKDE
jgi:hypothetical protein